jgi:hypothetical protein
MACVLGRDREAFRAKVTRSVIRVYIASIIGITRGGYAAGIIGSTFVSIAIIIDGDRRPYVANAIGMNTGIFIPSFLACRDGSL